MLELVADAIERVADIVFDNHLLLFQILGPGPRQLLAFRILENDCLGLSVPPCRVLVSYDDFGHISIALHLRIDFRNGFDRSRIIRLRKDSGWTRRGHTARAQMNAHHICRKCANFQHIFFQLNIEAALFFRDARWEFYRLDINAARLACGFTVWAGLAVYAIYTSLAVYAQFAALHRACRLPICTRLSPCLPAVTPYRQTSPFVAVCAWPDFTFVSDRTLVACWSLFAGLTLGSGQAGKCAAIRLCRSSLIVATGETRQQQQAQNRNLNSVQDIPPQIKVSQNQTFRRKINDMRSRA